MRDIDYKVKVVSADQAMEIFQNYEWTSILEVNGLALVRYGKLLDPTLLELFKEGAIQEKNNGQNRGTISSVAAAAATAAYSRILLNQYTNLPGNLAIYTDTDSVVLRKPLDDSMIGKDLGNMKLEHVIKQGIFIAPKTYIIKTTDGKIISKAKGVRQGLLKWDDYFNLLNGTSLTLQQSQFIRKFESGHIVVRHFDYKLRGLSIKSENMALVPYIKASVAVVPFIESSVALVSFVEVSVAVVPYIKSNFVMELWKLKALGLIAYLKPNLALVIINPNDPFGSGPVSKGTDPSWEIAFKGEDDGLKVSYIVFDPKLTDTKVGNNGPGLDPFIPKIKPKANSNGSGLAPFIAKTKSKAKPKSKLKANPSAKKSKEKKP